MNNTNYLNPYSSYTVNSVDVKIFGCKKGFSDNRLISKNDKSRENILELQEVMEGMESTLDEFKLTHHFAPGCYAREMLLPKGHTIIGKIHKHAHLNIVISGKVSVSTEDGSKDIVGGEVFTSYAGTKRAVYAHEDTVWMTIHVTDKTNLDDIEEDIIAKDFEEVDIMRITGEES